mmetsp:Transcript_59165/g.152180  ORF Transcript_59165/g.152180 Transcript_59165/m.152180 type:complete len:330 (+) Transcript_59165:1575-2564(+)
MHRWRVVASLAQGVAHLRRRRNRHVVAGALPLLVVVTTHVAAAAPAADAAAALALPPGGLRGAKLRRIEAVLALALRGVVAGAAARVAAAAAALRAAVTAPPVHQRTRGRGRLVRLLLPLWDDAPSVGHVPRALAGGEGDHLWKERVVDDVGIVGPALLVGRAHLPVAVHGSLDRGQVDPGLALLLEAPALGPVPPSLAVVHQLHRVVHLDAMVVLLLGNGLDRRDPFELLGRALHRLAVSAVPWHALEREEVVIVPSAAVLARQPGVGDLEVTAGHLDHLGCRRLSRGRLTTSWRRRLLSAGAGGRRMGKASARTAPPCPPGPLRPLR